MSVVLAAGAAGWVVFLLVGVPIWNHVERTQSASINAPPIILPDLKGVTFPDPLHVGLPDGRVFRLAHVVAPDPGTSEHAAAATRAWQVLGWGGNEGRGLKPVGQSPDGETLVELWGFQRSMGGCGNSTWAERRRQQIPHWRNLTWQLVTLGDFALERGTLVDAEAVAYEAAARRAGEGMWAHAQYLRRYADVAHYESVAFGAAKTRHTIWEHRQALTVLLRIDPATYSERAMRVIGDRTNGDVHYRTFLALAMDEAGRFEGTDYLMNVLRGRIDGGLDEAEQNSVVNNYLTHWSAADTVGFGDEAALVQFYETRILSKRPNTDNPVQRKSNDPTTRTANRA